MASLNAKIIRKWAPEPVIEKVLKLEERRMARAVQVVVGEVKRSINRGNRKGTNPSAPGEPPKKVSGRLFLSIKGRVTRSKRQVTGIIGAGTKYARRLELGFVGTDSKGRTYAQAPRPFLRPALVKSSSKVKTILGVA